MYKGLIEQYRDHLPVTSKTPVISLSEGQTPLIQLSNLPKNLGLEIDLWVKFEGLNPTGSFKDRGMTMAVSKACEIGAKAVICASTGNTSASAAAYAARANLACFVMIPSGKIAHGKLIQALMYGAHIVQIEGNFDVGMAVVKQLADADELVLVNSVNPYRLQGQKTASFEIAHALGRMPDYHCLPVGNAGNITAHWIGYCELAGCSTAHCAPWKSDANACPDKTFMGMARPKMLGYQAAGASPFVTGAFFDAPDTLATAIRIGHPQSWKYAWETQKESQGWFKSCTDDEILKTQKLLAEKEGVFCEPASAASIAGLVKDVQSGHVPTGSCVVCTLTGNGLKDAQAPMTHLNIDDHITKADHRDGEALKHLIAKYL